MGRNKRAMGDWKPPMALMFNSTVHHGIGQTSLSMFYQHHQLLCLIPRILSTQVLSVRYGLLSNRLPRCKTCGLNLVPCQSLTPVEIACLDVRLQTVFGQSKEQRLRPSTTQVLLGHLPNAQRHGCSDRLPGRSRSPLCFREAFLW